MPNMNSNEQPTSSTNASVGVIPRDIALIVVESCIFLCLNLAALVGNTLVCVVLYRNTFLRTVTNNFILSLAVTDLVMAVLVMPLVVCSSLANKWIGGTFGLQMYGYGVQILAGTSLLTVMLLAVNRYFRVVRPALYRTIYSKKSSRVMAVTAWIVSVVILGVGFLAFGVNFPINHTNPTIILPVFPSTSAFTFYVFAHSLLIGVAGITIVTCYVKIYQTIRHHNTAVAPSSQHGRSCSYGVEEAKITRILTAVLVGFCLCWLSTFVSDTFASLKLIGENTLTYYNFYYTFPIFVGSVINPLIYTTMNRPFRREFLKILRGNCL